MIHSPGMDDAPSSSDEDRCSPHVSMHLRQGKKHYCNFNSRSVLLSLLSPGLDFEGDCNSSAADDAVQATSCPAAFITFINAFNSAECCSAVENTAPLPLIKNRQLICFSTRRCCCVQRERVRSPRTAADNTVGVYPF